MLNKFFIEEHIKNALNEDIGFGDITTDYLTTEADMMSCTLNTRVDGIFCGRDVFESVFKILSPKAFCISLLFFLGSIVTFIINPPYFNFSSTLSTYSTQELFFCSFAYALTSFKFSVICLILVNGVTL